MSVTSSPSYPRLIALALVALLGVSPATAKQKGEPPGDEEKQEDLPKIAKKVEKLEKLEGLTTLYLDREQGKVWLEVPPPGDDGVAMEVIYLEGLATGLGSNPVGLDRGQMGESKLLRLRRVGEKVLFEQPNLAFRALSDNRLERRAVEQSFAPSVIWAGKVEALDGNGRSLIDLSPFLLRDAHDVVRGLAAGDHGTFSLDDSRSAVDLDAILAFPDNVELEAVLTYTSDEPGDHIRRTAPTPTAFTVVQHHSFVRLPDDGHATRDFDPRMPSYGLSFLDYAAPLDAPIRRSWIYRHRLQATDPAAERSPVEEPIVYHVDPGAPEPIRSALIEGAGWWADAFEAAGLDGAFRVEVLPEDAHPLDVRYNVIQWVHRSTRGWSYGQPIADPRTGEIIKGHVSLGSLRVRQDILLFEGLAGVTNTGTGAADDPVELALARIRQLAAHEVGHTLGFTHNFAASTYDARGSVMDYPAPLIQIDDDGSFDFSRAYGVGIGTWDKLGVRFAYDAYGSAEEEAAALEAIVREAIDGGKLFLSDADARPPGASDPRANLWDNGSDPVAELEHVMEVRRLALERFGEDNLASGRPLALIQEVLAPVYFHHRYQLEAAAKVLGGMEYSYAVKGDGQTPTQVVDGERQRRALEVLLTALAPEQLDLPDAVLELLAPRPFGYGGNRELFGTQTAPTFDALGAAATVAAAVTDHLAQPERLARMIDFARRDETVPSAEEVLSELVDATFTHVEEAPRLAAIRQAIARAVAERLIAGASAPAANPEVRTHLERALEHAADRLAEPGDSVARQGLSDDIGRFLDRDHTPDAPTWRPLESPPGSPIGQSDEWCSSGG